MTRARLGRFAEPALWVLVALRGGPARPPALLAAVRALDGQVGPATLLGALARLERRSLVERLADGDGPMYRLTNYHMKGVG